MTVLTTNPETELLLRMEGISKAFPGVQALSEARFELRRGEGHALVGENGAGKSTDLAKAIIQAHPNLKGFFGANEGSIIGVLNAVTEFGMEGKLVVIGYDSGKQQMDAIRAGTEAGAITQNPVGIGYKCVEAAVKASKGESLPKVIDTGFYWYGKTNVDDPQIKAVLYE